MSIAKVLLATDVPVRKGASSSSPSTRYSYSVSTLKNTSNPASVNACVSFGAGYDFDENSISCCLRCFSVCAVSVKNVEVWIAGGDRRFFSRFSNLSHHDLSTGDYPNVSEAMRIAITGEEMSAICTKHEADRIFVMFSGYLVFNFNQTHEVYCETVNVPESLLFSEQHLVSYSPVTTESKRLPSNGVNLMAGFEGAPFEADTFTDYVITCGDREFHVHRGILVGRSEVLKKMLAADMAEKKEGKMFLDPTSFGPEVVEKFLTKLYDTGFEISGENISELSVLIKLFHMYEIHDAVQECGKLLELQLHGDTENVFTVLKDSHLCGLSDVFAKAVAKLRGMGADVWDRPEMEALDKSVLAAALKASFIK